MNRIDNVKIASHVKHFCNISICSTPEKNERKYGGKIAIRLIAVDKNGERFHLILI